MCGDGETNCSGKKWPKQDEAAAREIRVQHLEELVVVCLGHKSETRVFWTRHAKFTPQTGLFATVKPSSRWHGLCALSGAMKNVSFTAGPKNGDYIDARLSGLHHSAEGRFGLSELVFAGVIMLALVGFALTIVR